MMEQSIVFSSTCYNMYPHVHSSPFPIYFSYSFTPVSYDALKSYPMSSQPQALISREARIRHQVHLYLILWLTMFSSMVPLGLLHCSSLLIQILLYIASSSRIVFRGVPGPL